MHARIARTGGASLALVGIVAGALLGAAAVPGADVSQARAADVPLVPPLGGFHSGVYVPFNDVPLGDDDDAEVVANGNLALSWANSDFEGELADEDTLGRFNADVDLRGAVTMELAVGAGGELAGGMVLGMVPLGALDFGPVDVVPWLAVDVQLSGQADAGAQVSVVAPFDLTSSFSFDGSPRSRGSAPRLWPELGPPDAANAVDLDGRIELGFTLIFVTSVEDLPIGGPVVRTAFGLQLHVDTAENPWWDLDGVTAVELGWAAPVPEGVPPTLPRDLRPLGQPARVDLAAATDPPPGLDEATRWSRAFDVANDDDGAAIVPVGSDLAVVEAAGTPWLAMLDGLGSPTWQQTDTESMEPHAMDRSDNDGDLVIAGVTGGATARVERFSAAGDPRWAKTMSIPDELGWVWTDLVARDDGSAFVAGTAGGRPIILALDPNGVMEWATEIETGGGSSDARIEALAESPTGELVAVGKVEYESDDGAFASDNALVLRLTADGAVVRALAIGGAGPETAIDVVVNDDGSYAFAGDSAGRDGDHFPWVVAMGADDTLRWSSTYINRPDVGFGFATGIAATEGGYLVSGITGMNGSEEAWLVRLDPGGMPLWAKTYDGTEDDELAGVVDLDDGYAAIGSTETTDDSGSTAEDIWVLRTSVDGMLHFAADSGFDTENDAVQWHESSVRGVAVLDPANAESAVVVDDAALGAIAAGAADQRLTM